MSPSANNYPQLRHAIESMPMASLFGFSIALLDEGQAEISLPYRREVSFRDGAFPATVLAAIADIAAGTACMTLLSEGGLSSTIAFSVNVVAPALGERLIARGRVVRGGTTISVGAADVFVTRGGEETLCATALVTLRNPPAQRVDAGHR